MGPSKEQRGDSADARRQYRAKLVRQSEEENRRADKAEAKKAAKGKGGGKK